MRGCFAAKGAVSSATAGRLTGTAPILIRPSSPSRSSLKFLFQAHIVRKHAVRPCENALALCSEADKALAPLDDQDAETFFELFDASRERRLGYIACCGGAREVALAGERSQILKIANDQSATPA